ncbi:MAG: hypothetical protein E7323_09180 [Clostridiales bacterium]|nr:hypothetical protein [Clostridiales bacterium]
MSYRNAQEIFPEGLLRQIQRYVSGETIYIPARNEKKAWGETSGYQRYIRERNEEIRTAFANGLTMEELMEKYALSYDSIKRIVYNRKETAMLKYSATLSSAKAYADAGKLDTWIHLYLNEEGRNIPFSDGLKLFDRYYFSPALFPIRLFNRCTGPEPDMKYQIDPDWWQQRVAVLENVIQTEPDLPPLIVHYVDGTFELNDGNHRHKAYENLGIENIWVIIWITEEAELDDFSAKYGTYVKDCKIIRR